MWLPIFVSMFTNFLQLAHTTNMHRNTHKHTHRRYSKNRNTGAAPKQKMGVGMVEQVAKQHAAREDTAALMPGTARQKKRERDGRSEDRFQLKEKQPEYVNEQIDRHKIAVRKLGID